VTVSLLIINANSSLCVNSIALDNNEKNLRSSSNVRNLSLKTSKFLEKGVLTPMAFVMAGDLLIVKCPGQWQWESGDPQRSISFLPEDKQFLITREPVPCKHRFRQDKPDSNLVVEDDWLAVDWNDNGGESEDIMDADEMDKPISPAPVAYHGSDTDTSDIPDMESFDEDNLIIQPDLAATANNLVHCRMYLLSICYDNYYQTPKLWLCGFDENGSTLSATEMFEDISADHAKKTVTLDDHPHLGTPFAFIHPCKNASVMKKFIDRMLNNGNEPRVDQYMFIFLKFLGAVIPTIDYDRANFEVGL